MCATRASKCLGFIVFCFFFSPDALCQTRCQLGRDILWAKRDLLPREYSREFSAFASRSIELGKENRVRFEALVFAKYLVIYCPFAASSCLLLPAGAVVLL